MQLNNFRKYLLISKLKDKNKHKLLIKLYKENKQSLKE